MGSTQILSQLDLIFALRVTLFSVVSVDDANPTVPFLPPAPPPPSAERGSVSRHHAIVITLMISRNILLRVSRARGRVSRGNNAERDRCCTFYTYTYISRTGWTVQPLPRVLLSFFFFFSFCPLPLFSSLFDPKARIRGHVCAGPSCAPNKKQRAQFPRQRRTLRDVTLISPGQPTRWSVRP